MIRRIACICAAAALTGAAAAEARPLALGAINGVDDLSGDSAIASCPAGDDAARICTLTRTDFGGLPVSHSRMTLDAEGRVRSVEIRLDAKDYDTARQLLAGRYGPPSQVGTQPRWQGFDGGASIGIVRSGGDSIIRFDFPANRRSAAPAGLDPDLAWALLLFTGIGLSVGLVLRRMRRAPALARGLPEPSMRAALERRMREDAAHRR